MMCPPQRVGSLHHRLRGVSLGDAACHVGSFNEADAIGVICSGIGVPSVLSSVLMFSKLY